MFSSGLMTCNLTIQVGKNKRGKKGFQLVSEKKKEQIKKGVIEKE